MNAKIFTLCFSCPHVMVANTYLQYGVDPSIGYAFLNYAFGAIGIIGLFIGGMIIHRYRRKETFNIFLGIFTLTTALVLLEMVLFWLNPIAYEPKIPFYKSLIFLWGPTLYLYFENRAFPRGHKNATRTLFKHYSIFWVSLVLLLIIGNTDLESPTEGFGFTWAARELLTNNWIKTVYFAFYIVLMVKQYLRDRKQLDGMGINWTKSLIAFVILLFFIAGIRAEFADLYLWDHMTKYMAAFSFSSFIIIIGYLNILFTNGSASSTPQKYAPEEKYRNSGLTEDMSQALKNQLIDAMENKKLFLDHALTLQHLADTLQIDRYSLSQVINQEFGKNFYEFVNDYRINESIDIIRNSPDRVELVTDLIYESGFNNKVSFYKAFKKREKMTPAQYIKEFMASV